MRKFTVGIFNDSFPPTIDGVANTVVNYALSIQKNHGKVVVATPRYPKVKDNYPFKVIRYASTYVNKKIGYRMGYPFSPLLMNTLLREKIDIIHVHSPFVSMILARVLRRYTKAPIVFTYHTKFDIDIQKRIATNTLQKASLKFILSNIQAANEVWVVSEGAGENLRSIGYKKQYKIMENGTDFKKGKSDKETISKFELDNQITKDDVVLLFVGRMMWYKNIKLIIDGLNHAKAQGSQFKMFFVGEGIDRPEIMNYSESLGLKDCIHFTGAITDREVLRSYFSRADLFMFPSTYDTNGIVVREAAACSCASLLVKESCASEGIVNGFTGVIVDETPEAVGAAIEKVCDDRSWIRGIGENAAEHVYISWEDAVSKAYEQYREVLKSAIKHRDQV